MAGLFSRFKTWITNEDLNADDLNAEFDNIIDNLAPNLIGPYSTTQAKLQETFDVGAVGSENLPTTLMEELQAERNLIKLITGKGQWYEPPALSLEVLASLVTSASTPLSRVNLGLVDAEGQPHFLKCTGTDYVVTLDATPTALSYYVNNSLLSQATDLTISTAGNAGPVIGVGNSTFQDPNNTGEMTKYLGEESSSIWLGNTAGTAFDSRLNTLSAFFTTNTGVTEIFLGVPRKTGTDYYINNCRRGYFFNGSQTNVRVQLAAAQSIRILAISYIFIKNDGTLQRNLTNNPPFIGGLTPVGPIISDYWFDTDSGIWKIYDGAAWNDSLSTFLGFTCQSDTVCIAARSVDFFKIYSSQNELATIITPDGTEVEGTNSASSISVYGQGGTFSPGYPKWSSLHLDTGAWASDRTYYVYLTKDFAPKFSLIAPHERPDLGGHYHISYPWRCVASVFTDSATPTFELNKATRNYGTSALLMPSSIGADKLRGYSIDTTPGNNKRELNEFTQTFIAVGTPGAPVTNPGGTTFSDTTAVSLLCSGRPICCYFISEATTGIVFTNLKISAYVQTRNESTATWTTIRAATLGDPYIATQLGKATVGTFTLITGMGAVSEVISGNRQFRVRFQIDDASGADYADYSLNGALYFFEM